MKLDCKKKRKGRINVSGNLRQKHAFMEGMKEGDEKGMLVMDKGDDAVERRRS